MGRAREPGCRLRAPNPSRLQRGGPIRVRAGAGLGSGSVREHAGDNVGCTAVDRLSGLGDHHTSRGAVRGQLGQQAQVAQAHAPSKGQVEGGWGECRVDEKPVDVTEGESGVPRRQVDRLGSELEGRPAEHLPHLGEAEPRDRRHFHSLTVRTVSTVP